MATQRLAGWAGMSQMHPPKQDKRVKATAARVASDLIGVLDHIHDGEDRIVRVVELIAERINKDYELARLLMQYSQEPMLFTKLVLPSGSDGGVKRDSVLTLAQSAEALVSALTKRGINAARISQGLTIIQHRVTSEPGFGFKLVTFLKQWAQAQEDVR